MCLPLATWRAQLWTLANWASHLNRVLLFEQGVEMPLYRPDVHRKTWELAPGHLEIQYIPMGTDHREGGIPMHIVYSFRTPIAPCV